MAERESFPITELDIQAVTGCVFVPLGSELRSASSKGLAEHVCQTLKAIQQGRYTSSISALQQAANYLQGDVSKERFTALRFQLVQAIAEMRGSEFAENMLAHMRYQDLVESNPHLAKLLGR